ncbi:MAG: glycosyltransferase family 2 protein [Pseudonocardiaceae bacterium]
MSMAPKVSVIIAAYNSMPYLHETLGSLSDQPYRPLEIVLVDDGSGDGTPEYVRWVRRWLLPGDVEFHLLRNRTNRGVACARNRGLAAATGDMLTFLDHDDVMLPQGISHRVEYLQRHQVDVVYARRDTLVHQDRERHVEHRVESYHSDGFTRLATKWEQFEYLLHKRVTFGHATLLYHRDVLNAVGLFREERELMGIEHNGWMLKLFHYFFAHYLDETVFLLRRGHRRDHLATVWDDNPDRSHVFDTVLVPRTLVELEGARP